MKSIRTRILTLTIMAVLVSVVTISVICTTALRRESNATATETMRMICYERSVTINDYLKQIELSLDIVSNFALSELDADALSAGGVLGADGWSGRQAPVGSAAGADQRALDGYLNEYCARVENVLLSAAERNDGVITFYYRINPELSMDEKGFLYSRIGGGDFAKIEVTDIGRYDPDDVEHVGWYYTPLRRGHASWLEPYDNENLGIKMISYVAPLYKEGTFIGVIGVDVSFDTLVDLIRDIRLYESDYAFLAARDGTIIYHPTLPSGYLPETYVPGLTEGFSLMARMDANTEPVRYTLDGVERQLFFSTISTGQKLVVSAPVKEINATWTRLAPRLGTAMLFVLLAFIVASLVAVQRITEPLKKLTAAARSIAEGDYNVELDYDGDDEVGLLTRTFQRLVSRLKDYINDLNSMAYRDAMTGVKNKAAYVISAQKLNDLIRIGGAEHAPKFAFVMFDCNDLKKINDSYGHEKGDVYLQTACKAICDVFIHCPVFRLGGDEFAALLTEETYERRERLLAEFDAHAAVANERARQPWEAVHIAKGLAAYDPAADADAEDVLRRADEAMYRDKQRAKAEQA